MRVRTAAIAMSAAAAAVVLTGCTDDTHGDEQMLKLTEATNGQFHPVGDPWPEANKPGGGFALAIPLADYSSGKSAGELNGVCNFTQAKGGRGGKAQCTGTADVSGGQLAIGWADSPGTNANGAIIGGTGKYAGAIGTFKSIDQGGGTFLDTFSITLP
jgi:hypothetical protein